MRKAIILSALAIGLLTTTGVHAQHSGHHGSPAKSAPASSQPNEHAGHGAATAQPKGDTSASSVAFDAANAKMHKDMDITYTGNADRDFVAGMIAHHQGAVEMAKIVIQYGKDPGIRKLAEEIVAAQEKEIAWMKDWQAKNPGK